MSQRAETAPDFHSILCPLWGPVLVGLATGKCHFLCCRWEVPLYSSDPLPQVQGTEGSIYLLKMQ